MKLVSVISGVPSKYSLNKPTDIELILKVEEIRFILQLMKSDSELYCKLSKFIE
jgi:hypothetical protein